LFEAYAGNHFSKSGTSAWCSRVLQLGSKNKAGRTDRFQNLVLPPKSRECTWGSAKDCI
jgi:hypothetical protein